MITIAISVNMSQLAIQENEVTKGLALGADAYITKPFSTQDLLGNVKRLLGEAA